jgi:hypothetical protein
MCAYLAYYDNHLCLSSHTCLSGVFEHICDRYIVISFDDYGASPFNPTLLGSQQHLLYTFAMPTAPYFSALFAAGTELWTYPKWQVRTKFIVPPFSVDATPALTGLDDREIRAVKAFSDRIHAITPQTEHIAALAKERDNDSDGRRAWDSWAKRNFSNWDLVQDLEIVLRAEGRHPRQLIGQQGFVSSYLGLDLRSYVSLHV